MSLGCNHMDKEIISKVKHFVKKEHQKPSATYGAGPFSNHILPVVNLADNLAKQLGADREVVVIAGYLHDIGSCIYDRETHHQTGAEIAENFLKKQNYPEEKTELVKKCIYNHRGSMNLERKSLEEKIIAEADTLSCFDNIPGLFEAALVHEGLDQNQAGKSVLEKMERKYHQLHLPESKSIGKSKIEALRTLLG